MYPSSAWPKPAGTLTSFVRRAKDSLEKHGGVDAAAFEKLIGLLDYVDGDYQDAATFRPSARSSDSAIARRTTWRFHPSCSRLVVEHLAKSDCGRGARVIVEKPFGHDLASAQDLNRFLLGVFDESDIFRIDHYLGKRPVQRVVLPLRQRFLESFWNRNHIESVQITMAEDFGVQGRGAFYDRDRNHPRRRAESSVPGAVQSGHGAACRSDSESIRDEKVKVLKAIPPLEEKDLVRGQFRGYRDEKASPQDSQIETFAALQSGDQFLALEGSPVLYPGRQVFARDLHRNRGPFRQPPTLYSRHAAPAPNIFDCASAPR